MPKKKIDIDKFQMDLMKGEVKHYLCEVPGCGQTTPCVDEKEHWIDTVCGKKANIGLGMGLVEYFCDGCGIKLCPHPSMKPRNDLPPMFCAPPPGLLGKGNEINPRHDNYDPQTGAGHRSALPEEYKNTGYCYMETAYFDHLCNLKTIVSCRKCAPKFEDEYRQIKLKKQLLGG